MLTDKIKIYINENIEKIHTNVLKGDKKFLVSLKILFPKDSSFLELQSILCLHPSINIEDYGKLDDFFRDRNKKIKKTLTFSKYKDVVKYQEINPPKYLQLPKPSNYTIEFENDIPIENSETWESKTPRTINEWWKNWGLHIQNNFCYGKYVLWSYVLLRIENKENIKEVKASVYAIFSKQLNEKERLSINKYFQELLIQLTVQQHNKEIRDSAIRASLTAVMARNMSHNIGSHVLSKRVTPDFIKDKSGDESKGNGYQSDFSTLVGELKYEDKEINFNSYLRSRMDFLAEIATGEPSMEVTRRLVADVIVNIDKNCILLNNISGVDPFPYSIIVKDCRNGQNENCGDECKCDGQNKDVPVSIPNDSIGYHALFIILENIIRNTAKHQKSIGKKNDFILEIRESKGNEELYEALIYDSVIIKNNHNFTSEDIEFYKKHTGEDLDVNMKVSELDWLVFEQNCRLNESVIDSHNRLRSGAWGLIEMDVCAAYLRKLAPETIDNSEYDLEFDLSEIKAKNTPFILRALNKCGKHLAYQFHLMKPKELLIVDEIGIFEELEKDQDKIKNLKENGILIINELQAGQIYSHPFLLVVAGVGFKVEKYLYNEEGCFRSDIPSRIIICGQDLQLPLSPWYAKISKDDKDHPFIEKIKSNDKTRFKRNNPNNPNTDETIMDLAWKIWLKNKRECCEVNLTYCDEITAKIINKYIFDDNNDKTTNFLPFSVRFDHHGENVSKFFTDKQQCTLNYYETYKSSVKYFVEEATIDIEPNFDKTKLAKIAESVFVRILILDERIQKICSNENLYNNIKRLNLLKACGIFIPEENEINLSMPSYYKQNFINKIIGKIVFLEKIDFVVIHLGVIEKLLLAENKTKTKDNVKRLVETFQNTLKNKSRVIITSGRGKPENLPESLPFIAFSTLSQNIVEIPFKPFLNQIIQGARKFKSN